MRGSNAYELMTLNCPHLLQARSHNNWVSDFYLKMTNSGDGQYLLSTNKHINSIMDLKSVEFV